METMTNRQKVLDLFAKLDNEDLAELLSTAVDMDMFDSEELGCDAKLTSNGYLTCRKEDKLCSGSKVTLCAECYFEWLSKTWKRCQTCRYFKDDADNENGVCTKAPDKHGNSHIANKNGTHGCWDWAK